MSDPTAAAAARKAAAVAAEKSKTEKAEKAIRKAALAIEKTIDLTPQQQQPVPDAAAVDALTTLLGNHNLNGGGGGNSSSSAGSGSNAKKPATPTSKFTPQSGSLVYRSDTIDKAALAQQIGALNGGVTPSTAGRAKVVVAPSPPPPQRTAEEIKAHLDRKFKAIHAAYKAAAPKTDEELRAEVMAVIRKVEKKTMSIQDVKAYTKQRDIAQYLRRDKFTDAMLATRIQKRVEDDDDDDDDSVSY